MAGNAAERKAHSAVLQRLHAVRGQLSAVLQIVEAPDIVRKHGKLDAERVSALHVINSAFRSGCGRCGNIDGIKRIVTDERLVVSLFASLEIAAEAGAVVREIIDIACVPRAQRNAPFQRAVVRLRLIRGRIRPR